MVHLTRRALLNALGGAVALGTFDSERSAAQSDGSGVAERYLANDDLLDNAELERALRRLSNRAPGRVSHREIGTSSQDRRYTRWQWAPATPTSWRSASSTATR